MPGSTSATTPISAHVIGAPTAIGAAGDGRLTSVMEIHDNISVEENNAAARGIRQADGARRTISTSSPIDSVTQFEMLVRGDQQGRLDRPVEGRAGAGGHGAEGHDRRRQHHAQGGPPAAAARYYEAVFTKGRNYDVEKTGHGLEDRVRRRRVADETLPTTCKMKRPAISKATASALTAAWQRGR